jgi:hypothetical protein
VISYTQKTWKTASGEPMHAESGYWRPRPDGSVDVVIAQSTGLAEVQVSSSLLRPVGFFSLSLFFSKKRVLPLLFRKKKKQTPLVLRPTDHLPFCHMISENLSSAPCQRNLALMLSSAHEFFPAAYKSSYGKVGYCLNKNLLGSVCL